MRCGLLLIAALWVLPAAAAEPPRAPAALDVSALLFHEWSLKDGPALIDRVAKTGGKRVNVVVTLHGRIDEKNRILDYGLVRAEERGRYVPFDDTVRRDFTAYMKAIFAAADRHGLEIAVLPHIDTSGPRSAWRNHLDLDVQAHYAGHSYVGVMIDPLVEALAAVRPGGSVELSLSGEMGRSVFAYPESYQALVTDLRARKLPVKLKLGVSLNHGGVAGTHRPTPAQSAAVQRLVEALDFVGFSCYRAVSAPPRPADFTAAVEAFVGELKQNGVTLPADKEVHFSEIGIGGYKFVSGGRPMKATTPAEAASSPWEGTSDPRQNPWEDAALRDFRRAYHGAALEFLRTQPARWRVARAYLWSMGSWDPHGLINPEFADPEIARTIRMHNDRVR